MDDNVLSFLYEIHFNSESLAVSKIISKNAMFVIQSSVVKAL